MLKRHVEVLNGLWGFCNCGQKCIRDMGRVCIHNADPLDLIDLAKCSYQSREGVNLAEVLTITRRILGYENEFLNPLFGKVASLLDDRAKTSRTKTPAH